MRCRIECILYADQAYTVLYRVTDRVTDRGFCYGPCCTASRIEPVPCSGSERDVYTLRKHVWTVLRKLFGSGVPVTERVPCWNDSWIGDSFRGCVSLYVFRGNVGTVFRKIFGTWIPLRGFFVHVPRFSGVRSGKCRDRAP